MILAGICLGIVALMGLIPWLLDHILGHHFTDGVCDWCGATEHYRRPF